MGFEKEILTDPGIVKRELFLLLSANNQEPIKGKLWYQKLLFLLSKNNIDLAEECGFDAYLFGPHSELVDAEMEELSQLGLVSTDNGKYSLTEKGSKLAKELKKNAPKSEIAQIEELKRFINGLSRDELLLFIYVSFPGTADEAVEYPRLLNDRKKIAIGMYHKGKISIGKAAQLAGVSVQDLIRELQKKGIYVVEE